MRSLLCEVKNPKLLLGDCNLDLSCVRTEKWGRADSFRYHCCFIWLDVSLPVLDKYVDQRVDCMIDNGLLLEVYDAY